MEKMKYPFIFFVCLFTLGCNLGIQLEKKSTSHTGAHRGGERQTTYTLSTAQDDQHELAWGSVSTSKSFYMECENHFQGQPAVLTFWDFMEANRGDFDSSAVGCNSFSQLGVYSSRNSNYRRMFQYNITGLPPFKETFVDASKLPVGVRFMHTLGGKLVDLEFLQMKASNIVQYRTSYQGSGYALGRTASTVKLLYCGAGGNNQGYVVTGVHVHYEPNILSSAEILGVKLTCSKVTKN